MDTDRDLASPAEQALNGQSEEEQLQLEPSPKYTENMKTLTETCRGLTSQIQNTLLQLKALLNGNLDTLLVHEPATKTHGNGNREIKNQNEKGKIQNLKNLLEEETQDPEDPKTKRLMDMVIIRSRISGAVKTILVNMFSGYKEAVNTLIENLNTLLREFAKAYDQLRETHAKFMTEVAKVNLNRHEKAERDAERNRTEGVINFLQLKEIPRPELPKDIKPLPDKVNPALITQEILEENLRKHYGVTSSDQPQA